MKSILPVVMLCAFVISIPLYILYLGMLIRFRKKKPFSSPFFTICIVLGILDIIGLLNTWFLTNFPVYGWFGMDVVVKKFPTFWAKVFKTVAWWYAFGSTNSVLIMAFNRMTNVAFPLKHQLIWTRNFIKFVIFFQIGLPLIMTLPNLATEFDYHVVNGTEALGPTIYLDRRYHIAYYSLGMIHLMMANIASLLMYLILFCKNRFNQIAPNDDSSRSCQRIGPGVTQNQDDDLLRKVQKKMVIFGLIMFLLLSLIGIYVALMMTTKDPIKFAIYLRLRAVFVDIFAWINPYLALALSHTVRAHFKAFVMRRQIEEDRRETVRMDTSVRHHLRPRPARIIDTRL